jgi:hypothetical protein
MCFRVARGRLCTTKAVVDSAIEPGKDTVRIKWRRGREQTAYVETTGSDLALLRSQYRRSWSVYLPRWLASLIAT